MVMGIRVRLFLALAMACAILLYGTGVHSYNRPPPREDIAIHYTKDDEADSSPQQVHISLVGEDQMRISWITKGSAPARVDYGVSSGVYGFTKSGTTSSYRYVTYESGSIHDVVIGPLAPNTVYYYRCGDASSPEFTLKTPPAAFPIKFVLAGDLGQTGWTISTLDHIAKSNYDILILSGDLSYADIDTKALFESVQNSQTALQLDISFHKKYPWLTK